MNANTNMGVHCSGENIIKEKQSIQIRCEYLHQVSFYIYIYKYFTVYYYATYTQRLLFCSSRYKTRINTLLLIIVLCFMR